MPRRAGLASAAPRRLRSAGRAGRAPAAGRDRARRAGGAICMPRIIARRVVRSMQIAARHLDRSISRASHERRRSSVADRGRAARRAGARQLAGRHSFRSRHRRPAVRGQAHPAAPSARVRHARRAHGPRDPRSEHAGADARRKRPSAQRDPAVDKLQIQRRRAARRRGAHLRRQERRAADSRRDAAGRRHRVASAMCRTCRT